MTERDEKAVQALVEAMPDTDPFGGPVQYLAAKLELSNSEAHALTLELITKQLICTARATPTTHFGKAVVASRAKYVWRRLPELQNQDR
ncbi:MAG TPA: hypothetical protein VKR43_00930 [Bryobacteraceae bacterium]|nr:hypothetical protein [Bryobacteraceae bacterium]